MTFIPNGYRLAKEDEYLPSTAIRWMTTYESDRAKVLIRKNHVGSKTKFLRLAKHIIPERVFLIPIDSQKPIRSARPAVYDEWVDVGVDVPMAEGDVLMLATDTIHPSKKKDRVNKNSDHIGQTFRDRFPSLIGKYRVWRNAEAARALRIRRLPENTNFSKPLPLP